MAQSEEIVTDHRMPMAFWVLMAPVTWAIGDLVYPLIFGEPSIILTHFGLRLSFGC